MFFNATREKYAYRRKALFSKLLEGERARGRVRIDKYYPAFRLTSGNGPTSLFFVRELCRVFLASVTQWVRNDRGVKLSNPFSSISC